jgi:hypothetical protein
MIVLTLLEYVGGGNVVVETGESRCLSAGRMDVATKEPISALLKHINFIPVI